MRALHTDYVNESLKIILKAIHMHKRIFRKCEHHMSDKFSSKPWHKERTLCLTVAVKN